MFSTSISSQINQENNLFGQEYKCGNLKQKTNKTSEGKEYEERYANFVKSNESLKPNSLFTIPIVVHVFYGDRTILGTINDNIIKEIQQASDRFRHQQPDAGTYSNPFYGIDTEIELCLVDSDEQNNYSTGIYRYYNPDGAVNPLEFSNIENYLWDVNKYLNIVIVDKFVESYAGISINNIVIIRSSFFNDGLICHEVGHHFSLLHPYGTCINNDCLIDGDKVCDTPPKLNINYDAVNCMGANSCTTDEDDTSQNNPYRSTSLGGMGDQDDMVISYMETRASCWDSFSEGQKQRMHFNILNRPDLTSNSIACESNPDPLWDICTRVGKIIPGCGGTFTLELQVSNCGLNTIHSLLIDIYSNDVLLKSIEWNGIILANETAVINNIEPIQLFNFDINKLDISFSLNDGNQDPFDNNNHMTLVYEPINSFFYNEPDINCKPDGNLFGEGGISLVTLRNSEGMNIISNGTLGASSVGNYEVFGCGLSSNMELDEEYEFLISVGGDQFFEKTHIYLDYNADGNFSGSELVAYTNSFWSGLVTPSVEPSLRFTTPVEVTENELLRLRVVTNRGPVEPCTNPATGQIEDYFVYFGNLVSCEPSYSIQANSQLMGVESSQAFYETEGLIESFQEIENTATVTYDSGIEISLLEPFEVQLGAIFHAFINGCGE